MTNNKFLLNWIEKIKNITRPEKIVWINGDSSQIEDLRNIACKSRELIKLNPENLPNCYLHRSQQNDVCRVEDRTFICTKSKDDTGITNNWMDPDIAYKKLYDIAKNAYNGRTMYIIPFIMGPGNSSFSKIGVEITDSIYVVLNMNIMTKIGKEALINLENSNNFTRCLHCTCNINEKERYICHFPEDNTIISLNSAYGGNALLSKKCLGLRLASYFGKNEGWLAEHMLILGIKRPNKETKYILAAFPSACGKTNFAMLIPPKEYRDMGYEISCIGDDIAWIRKDASGRLMAVNPETGFFGVAPGTNKKTNMNALISTQKDTIFTNVAYDTDNGTVWWEGLNKTPPKNMLDWKGEPRNKEKSNQEAAHPNSRFTSPIANCPCLDDKYFSKYGVPISAIIFGGRRKDTIPLVYESFDWEHGVFVGSAVSSQTTAAANGNTGIVRHDPFAMLPFCGYNMCDYFSHWLNFYDGMDENAPKIFNVNWFQTDDFGMFMWPGFGENIRVLDWIIKRCEGTIDARKTPIGYIPKDDDINIRNTNISNKILKKLLCIDKHLWIDELDNLEIFYKTFESSVPSPLISQLKNIQEQINKM